MRYIAFLLFLIFWGISSGQVYKVESFEILPMDLSARLKPRMDNNGRKCGMVRIMVPDRIVEVQGAVIGGIEEKGLEKNVYLSHDCRQIRILFGNHYPLDVKFMDYGIPVITEQMTYSLYLTEDNAVVPVSPQPSAADILEEAIKEYDNGNFEKALPLFSSVKDNPKAQYYIGEMYYSGNGVPQDYAEGISWLRKSAEQGNAEAQICLGYIFFSGEGVAQDYLEAKNWYFKSAIQGNAMGQLLLGNMYYEGEGVPQDCNEAVRWYRMAAEQGNADAQTILGSIYFVGECIPEDYTEAVHWLRKSAEQGNAGAQYILGLLYENGIGVAKDYTEAARWYRKSAEQGDADAQYKLGEMYRTGRGVPCDTSEAKLWYRKSADQGNENALFFLIILKGEALINGHEYVDLGLPSGLKWATMNVGATSPDDYGSYFAWGETEPKEEYTESNSRTFDRNYGDIGGNAEFDAARANWGSSWRLPTQAECEELLNQCTWTYTTIGNHKGYKVVGPNGNHIFLPAAGNRNGSSLYYAGESGIYWTSSPGSSSQYGCVLCFYGSSRGMRDGSRRLEPSVRPVSE